MVSSMASFSSTRFGLSKMYLRVSSEDLFSADLFIVLAAMVNFDRAFSIVLKTAAPFF